MQFSQNSSSFVLQYQGRYYPLNKPQIIIGSDQSCDIQIENNPQVLPMHVQLISRGGQVFLQYMERGAGIWVNGLPVSQQALHDQDEIAVGDRNTKLILQLNKQAAESGLAGLQVAQNIGMVPPSGISPVGMGIPPKLTIAAMPLSTAPPSGAPQQSSMSAVAPQIQTPSIGNATDTTRYLCAAGHLDEGFQDYVMHHVIYEERRALGESYGVDMPLVVSWCKAGLQRINARDWFLVIFLVLVIFGYFLINVLISSAFGGIFQLIPALGGIFQLFSGTTIILAIIFVPIGFNIEKWLKQHWPRSLPGLITYPLLFIVCGPLVSLVWLTIFVELIQRFYGKPTMYLRKDTFNPQARPVPLDYQLESKLRASFATGQRNVIAYSGYKPFAGAGYYKGGWSFVIDTSKGASDASSLAPSDRRLSPQAFTISSLYDAVEKDVWALGIKNIEIEGKLYVRGKYLPEHLSFFDKMAIRPVTSVDPRLVEQYKEQPTEDVRYYQCLRFNFWRGDMIFTAFLRFVRRGKELFAEVDYLLLPPMKDEYHWIDEKEFTAPISKIWQLYKRSFESPIQTWFGAPSRLLRGYFYRAEQHRLTRIAVNSPAFDYGASTSLRQVVSDDVYHLFFQELDEEMYLKIIEKQILETIINFLDAHQIDTNALREREQAILNNNTIFNGPTNIGAQAIGVGAQAHSTTTQAKQSSQTQQNPKT